MFSKRNCRKEPVCNSIRQNIGYFFTFVEFLVLNDAESIENLWRLLLRIESNPKEGLVSLWGFIKCMDVFMLVVTTGVALFKSEAQEGLDDFLEDDVELDASKIRIGETYRRLWAACELPVVQTLFLELLICHLPTALSDNVKQLKAVEFGLSKQTTALLSPLVILPLGIAVPIIAIKI